MKQNSQGFSLFAGLIAVTLFAVVGVVTYVALKKPVTVSGLPSSYVAPTPQTSTTETQTVAMPTVAPTATPAPTISTSTDLQVIGKELDDTKTDSVDADFNAMNSSASSL